MTQALKELLEKVEEGELPEAVFHGTSAIRGHWAYITGLDAAQRRNVYLSYRGSLDAAKALHEALLPGWEWETDGTKYWRVWTQGDEYLYFEAPRGENDARAWLICILKAKIAEEDE